MNEYVLIPQRTLVGVWMFIFGVGFIFVGIFQSNGPIFGAGIAITLMSSIVAMETL